MSTLVMLEIALHPLTRSAIDTFVEHPGQSLAIIGSSGIGKQTIATYIKDKLLPAHSPYFITAYNPDEPTVGIEAIRAIEHQLRLKVPTKQVPNRIVWIEQADTMTHEAQNALLKTLEEPPAGTIIILGVAHEQRMLPTIMSRVSTIVVRQPERQVLQSYFATQGFSASDVTQALLSSGGLPGLMHALLVSEDHPLIAATREARELLTLSRYDRMLRVDALAKDKKLSMDIFYILQQMAHVRLGTADAQDVVQWGLIMEQAYSASESLQANGQPKLVWDKLLLNL